MTKIKDIFQKDINRSIRGVIKIGQVSEAIKKQELEEYVVTDELKRNFTSFFDAYDKSIDQPTDEMGAWISGFFGTGKSHFLKILSYLLENDTIAGRKAIDYFLQDGKFKDDHLATAINKASSVPTDVALFNIDSKADSNAASDSNAILNVFLKVFNEKLGYSPIAEIANMERWLDSINKYLIFQDEFQKLDKQNHSTWKQERNSYILMRKRIRKALINIGALSEEDATSYVTDLKSGSFHIDTIGFAKLVKNYLDKKGKDAHFVFLADEVGQFIGDDDKRMLNLQTIVEQLGIQCQGRAWVVVTSQQEMNEVTGNFAKHERDFSKIQGRFNTLITMSSTNASEVIRKRLLAKKPLAKEELEDIFAENKYTINNKINFSDAIRRDKFDDSKAFVDNYPFIPYQFDLLKDVLTAVRKRGANGSHMSDAERSMLATFQEATKRYENDTLGKLVPFSAFFIGMKGFLSHDHQVVFDRAQVDSLVNKNKEEFPFNIQVLAVLFMVRYVDNYPSTIENITTLLLDDINEDRQELKNKVNVALKTLLKQNFIQQKLDTYEFLTNSEQEVNEAINAIEVSERKVSQRIGSYLVSSNLIDAKYTYPNMKNQYIFEFNMYIDGIGLNRPDNELNIKIVSPLTESGYRKLDFQQQAQDGSSIIVVLKDDDRYIRNYEQIEKIAEYLQTPESRSDEKKQAIAINRSSEARETEDATHKMLEDDLREADIYVLDDVLDKHVNFINRLQQAKREIIDNSYRNLSYLTDVKSEEDILDILKGKNTTPLFNDDVQAINEVVNYINFHASALNSISFANIVNKFGKIPYGYKLLDVAWITATAFTQGRVKLYFNNSQISINEAIKDPKTVERYFIRKSNTAKLTLKPVKEISSRQKTEAKKFVTDVLRPKQSLPKNLTTERMAEEIQKKTRDKVNHLQDLLNTQKYDYNTPYPGHDLLQEGINELRQISETEDSDRIFQIISDHLDKLENWHDKVADKAILDFYGDVESQSDDEKTWNESYKYRERFNRAKGFIEDDKLENIVNDINEFLVSDDFNTSIRNLMELNGEFIKRYNHDMDISYQEIIKKIQSSTEDLKKYVDKINLPQTESKKLRHEIDNDFNSIRVQANTYNGSEKEDAYLNLLGLNNNIKNINQELRAKIPLVSRKIAAQKKEAIKSASSQQSTSDRNSVANTNLNKSTQKIKVSISKNINELVAENSWNIESEADIDKYLNSLKIKLQHELENSNFLKIYFNK